MSESRNDRLSCPWEKHYLNLEEEIHIDFADFNDSFKLVHNGIVYSLEIQKSFSLF